MPFNIQTDAIGFIKQLGLAKGTFIVFFLAAHSWLYNLYNQRVKDAKEQIKRIADENKEYRERFLTILDDKFGFKSKCIGPPPIPDKDKKEGGKK